jgi:hypothetical protein
MLQKERIEQAIETNANLPVTIKGTDPEQQRTLTGFLLAS